MAGKPKIELSVDQTNVVKVGRLVRAEANGVQFRKDLIADLKAAVAPGVSAVQSKLRAIPRSASGTASNPPLGSYLASRVRPQVRLSGRSTGVRVRIGSTPNLREFKQAARVLNRKSWRHKVYGRDIWVTQESPIPGYFDDTLAEGRERYRAAVMSALRKRAFRLGKVV